MSPPNSGAGPAAARLGLRIAFLGSAEFSLPTLAALIEAGCDVAAVYTQPPRPAGRGQRARLSPVHAFAEARGLPVRTPRTLRDEAEQAALRALGLDAAVVAAYGLILPAPALAAPRLGCLNVHGSLLPRWRGAAPIQRAIEAGDARTGVTIMQMDEGLDTGAILLAEAIPIEADATAQSVHDALAALGGPLMARALEGVAAGTLRALPQPAEGATYARKLERGEGRLDWTRPAAELERRVRAFNPWPGAWFERDGGERVRVLAAELAADAAAGAPPGTTLDDRLAVACGEGALRLLRLQREGRAALPADAFLRGAPIARGARLA